MKSPDPKKLRKRNQEQLCGHAFSDFQQQLGMDDRVLSGQEPVLNYMLVLP
jgi:hypothetical protein